MHVMYAPQHVENNQFLKYAVVLSVYAVRIRVHAGNEYACKYAHTKHVQSICCDDSIRWEFIIIYMRWCIHYMHLLMH